MDDKMTPFYEQLCKIAGESRVFTGEPMSKHTSFRVGGPAKYLVEVAGREELCALIGFLRTVEREYYVIGNGTNLLVSDAGYRGVILSIGKGMQEIRREGELLICQAGATLPAVAAFARREGLSGFEFASGIPGTIGGAIVMNAGAYGGEMKQVVESVEAVMKDGTMVTLRQDDLDLRYRSSVFKKIALICTEVILRLSPGDPEEIKASMEELAAKRKEKQPLEYPSAGSTFKRPEGYFAGKLIMDAGLSGYRVGDAQVSEKHCGFVINRGNATAEQIHELMDHVIETVEEKYGVTLEPEVIFLG